VNPARRHWLLRLGAAGLATPTAHATNRPRRGAEDPANDAAELAVDAAVRRGRTLAFPRDHGAHLGSRTEWWYATGWLGTPAAPELGFQVTFFRSRTGLAQDNPSRFAPRHLLFAHAAVTLLAAKKHWHDERITRWSGAQDSLAARAASADADVHIGPWRLHRDATGWQVAVPARDFTLALQLAPTQPLLLQGDAGFSRKGPQEAQASYYYSAVQLQTSGTVTLAGAAATGPGRAWLDHEWSHEILHPEAVGWDWIGMNLFDGSALTAFVLRRADGSALWAGGSFRAAGAGSGSFAPGQVAMAPGRRWRSPASNTSYPVDWQIDTPAGRFTVQALMDAQELDSRASTGTIYWEGLSELLDAQGRRVGLGYLEMTGYAARLRL
jgi:predicted secreted hydrolase